MERTEMKVEAVERNHRATCARERLLAVLLVAAALAGVSACKPSVPAQPTWHDDVFPLMQARCIRCHDDPPRSDPTTNPAVPPSVAFNFNFPELTNPPQSGAATLQSLGPKAIRGQPLAPGAPPARRMPPPPAEPLADWEMQIIDNWSKENPLQ